jgi:aminopeptidase N
MRSLSIPMKQLFVLISIALLLSCHSTKTIYSTTIDYDNEELDTLVVRADRISKSIDKPSGSYRATAKRNYDLLHSSLDIRLDWKNARVLGIAELDLTPYFYSSAILELDAVNFDINSITLLRDGEYTPLKYTYDQKKLSIQLDRTYHRQDSFRVRIDYIAHPAKDAKTQAFSIGSDQGLFFINPRGDHPGKPRQVWTQGETQYNSRWFPTIDRPNERCTQDLSITVADSLETLSNGLLIAQDRHEDGTRTDHWRLELPHAPYLFALVVGDYAIAREKWKDIELAYYVYPEYADDASMIYNHTPEMLSFFSEITGFPYPWPKYSQVIVSDFVSGAMENSTAVIFAESFQKAREDLVDFPNDMIVAHEMFHHWFGNLVTCESWANLTLNEGFANYAEYLWQEHKYGEKQAAMYHLSELNQYLMAAQNHTHPLIDFEYANRDAMFDAHSYNKGSLILHMLREYLGDEAFFEGLRIYLEEHAYSSAEAHDLRLVFEKVSGEDLNWFFNQWFFDKGHPVLETSYVFSDSSSTVSLNVEQVQDVEMHRGVFQFPLHVQVFYRDGSSTLKSLWINEKSLTHEFKVDKEVELLLLNPGNTLLCELDRNYNTEEWAFLFRYADDPITQHAAIQKIKYEEDYSSLIKAAIQHDAWQIRVQGIQNLAQPGKKENQKLLIQHLKNDAHPLVRSRAFRILNRNDLLNMELVLDRLQKDSSATMISLALDWLNDRDPAEAEKYAIRYLENRSTTIGLSVASILQSSGKAQYLPFFEERIFKGAIFMNAYLLRAYSTLLESLPPELMVERAHWLAAEVASMKGADYEKNYYLQVIRQQVEHLVEEMEKGHKDTEEQKSLGKHLESLRKMLRSI